MSLRGGRVELQREGWKRGSRIGIWPAGKRAASLEAPDCELKANRRRVALYFIAITYNEPRQNGGRTHWPECGDRQPGVPRAAAEKWKLLWRGELAGMRRCERPDIAALLTHCRAGVANR